MLTSVVPLVYGNSRFDAFCLVRVLLQVHTETFVGCASSGGQNGFGDICELPGNRNLGLSCACSFRFA